MIAEPAIAIAASICWLARQDGLPDIPVLRTSVVQRHPTTCSFCGWPLRELLTYKMDPIEERAFARLPQAAQRRLVEKVQEQPVLMEEIR